MLSAQIHAENHNLAQEIKFYLKSKILVQKRQIQNFFATPQKFTDTGKLINASIIAKSETLLWNPDDNAQNRILTAGKIENLRIASRWLNGIEVPAGKVFSFWKHIGRPVKARGFVTGREIREGCILPTIGGGLCQLSNALYDAALKAGFEIIERHRHTKVIKGSLAEKDRDATVKWNYVDLRFRAKSDFRIEIEMTADKFIVRFSSTENQLILIDHQPIKQFVSSKLNDCYACGNQTCFKHTGKTAEMPEGTLTSYILDEKWTEYETWVNKNSVDKDAFILPFRKNKLIKPNKYSWALKNNANTKFLIFTAMCRAFVSRLSARTGRNVFASMLKLDKKLALAAARHIPVESTHLVISQNLLPFLWEAGVLGGRTYDVLMTRLPMQHLHERLNRAHEAHPESKTLHDFRAPQSLIDLENSALTKSNQIITPHTEIAYLFKNKALLLHWAWPKVISPQKSTSNKILFPGAALGRKGAYEIRTLAKELNLNIVISGGAKENDNFWEGTNTEQAGPYPLENIGLVIYPAWVEHQPRILLRALASGIPVITTKACGLPEMKNLTMVEVGDYAGLKKAVLKHLHLN